MARLLIVEDHPDSCEAMALYLRRLGHNVDCAADGREALEHILDRTPELIILDLYLPEMNGADLMETIRSYVRLHALPVVVMTAYPEGPLAVRARSLQAGAVLAKASTPLEKVAETVQTVLADHARRVNMPLEKWKNDEISPL